MTRVGRALSQLHLISVPSFFNVIVGDMSLVGPKAERRSVASLKRRESGFINQRQLVRPGLTGWARMAATAKSPGEAARESLHADLFYLENLSLRLDLKIILRTVWLLLRGKER
jgi:lipopolysaccharide/colanic/teichoic acid biosynthesis glycosyltransferase